MYSDGSYIDPFMLSDELMDLSMNAELSPMAQNFLTIVSYAMMMDPMAWEECSNFGMCYLIEMSIMDATMMFYDGSYIDLFMLSDELMDLSMNNSQSSCSVTWTNEAGDFVGDGMTLSGLASGLYTANMTHSNGCTDAQTIEVGYSCAGCMDPLACNYSDIANEDDGLCQYLDSCGVCGGDGIAEGACDCDGNVLDATGVCGGDCEDDYNGNGVCDNAEIHGCTYSDASNYNPEATDDNGSCTYDNCDPNAGYDSGYAAGEASVDITSDNESVYNQGYEAGSESVICPETSSCPSDLDGNGSITTSDLLVFLSSFGQICD